MTYVKNTWADQNVEFPRTYTVTKNGGGSLSSGDTITLTDSFGNVTEIGTPVNATNMNHIEDGIEDCYTYVNTQITAMLQTLYPVGSIYISTSATNPLENLFGTWTLVAGGCALWTGNGQAGSGTTTNANYQNAKANTTIQAGLPNITGDFVDLISHDANSMGNATGAFRALARNDNAIHQMSGGASGVSKDGISFDASRSSTVYGRSATVQPPAYVVNIWRRTA